MSDALELILVLLAAAVVAVTVFRAFNLPPVLAYLLVGAALGPHAAAMVPDSEQGRHFAEYGVVFLMFSIGLEFSLPRLFAMKRIVFLLGGMQVLGTIALFCLLGIVLGLGRAESFAVAGAVSMSSTAILSKLLADRLELDAAHGRQVIGVLLFQDLAVVPLLILIPALSQPANVLAETLGWAAVKVVVVMALLLVVGQKVMRPWFHLVAKRKSSELFMLNILLVTLTLAWVTEQAGLSLALGAFMAGMLISETEYRYQVEEDIKPFRDVLLGLFMVSVGMFLDFAVIVENFLLVIGFLLVLLVLKFAVVWMASRLVERSNATAMRAGLWLCAGGEFGFVILTQASGFNIISPEVMQIVIAGLVLSLLAAPLLVQASDKIVMRFVASEWLMRSMELTKVAAQSIATDQHVLICGFGRSGQYLARFLEQEHVGYVALDTDPDRVREAAAAGETVVYGDASRRETLIAAGVSRASAVVISFNDVRATLRVMHHVQAVRPDLPIVARVVDEHDMELVIQHGAAQVVPEMLETSIMLATHTLTLIGLPITRVIRRMRDIRTQRYGVMRGFFHGANEAGDRPDALQERLHSMVLEPGAYAIGRTIDELGLQNTGATVTAVRRRGIRAVNPTPDTRFIDGDVVVILGVPAELARAEEVLLKGG
ncbi:MAG: cation:proton antiporter [Rhodocyclaceae bacterium]